MRKHFNGKTDGICIAESATVERCAIQWKEIFDSQMKTSFLKSLGIVSLSLLLLHSGIAWTLENCLEDSDAEERAGYSETSTTPPEPAVPSLTSPLNYPRYPITIIHCPVSHYEIGPMVQTPSGSRLAPSEKSVLLKTSLARESEGTSETNSLWSRALFEWFLWFPSQSGLSRHLFLSVFRI